MPRRRKQPPQTPNAQRATPASSSLRATGLTLALVLLSRVLGLVREKVVAYLFGQTDQATIFKQAFAVPDLIALVIAGGALSAVFVPVFTRYWTEDKKADAWKVFGTVVTIAGLVVAVLVLGMELFSVPLTKNMNPNFDSPESIETAARLTRILLPAQWCLLIGGLMQGTLYARKRFLIPGLAGSFYNLGQIVGGVFFGRTHGTEALAWGATIGALVGNVILPLWDMFRSGSRWRLGLDFSHPGVKQVGALMIPVLLGQSLSQLNMWLTGRLLSDDYRFAALNNAYTLTQAPIGIFAQAFGIVLLPTISAFAAQKDWAAFRKAVSDGLRQVLFLTVPASVLMAALATPLVRLFLKGGAYTEDHVAVAASCLIAYSVATFAWSSIAILARAFYAQEQMKLPALITTPMVFLYFGAGVLYTRQNPGGYLGLAVLTSLIGIVTALIFLIVLERQVGGLHIRAIARTFLEITAASLLAGAVAFFVQQFLAPFLPTGAGGGLILCVLAGIPGILVYVAACRLLNVRELQTVARMLRR